MASVLVIKVIKFIQIALLNVYIGVCGVSGSYIPTLCREDRKGNKF